MSSALLLLRKSHSGYHRNALRDVITETLFVFQFLSNAGTTVENSMKLRGCLKDKLCVTFKDAI